MNNRNLAIACDHAAYEMKEQIKAWLTNEGWIIKDFGTNNANSCDYADFAHPLAYAIEKGEFERGITLCGSGNGITMTVNKHQGIRAALCWTEEISILARSHNNANVCSMPARFISLDTAKAIVTAFLNTEFEGGRHLTRINKIPVSPLSPS
jgi:ribose 5-phosphate isomerase B